VTVNGRNAAISKFDFEIIYWLPVAVTERRNCVRFSRIVVRCV
jgi:hypothetical protein